MNEPWRLLAVSSHDGPENMAIDEAILTLVGEGLSPPTLRFYTWNSTWVSLGSGQLSADLDSAALSECGWGTVRRASGGTAVIHQGQLGYALVLRAACPIWRGDLVASYARLSHPFHRAFADLGAETDAAPPGQNSLFTANAPSLASRACFAALGPHELLAGGRKLIGNSQVRRRLSSSQHGVIQVASGQTEIARIIATESPDERASLACFLDDHVTSLSDAIGRPVGHAEIVDALGRAVPEDLKFDLVAGTISDQERRLADDLVASKYGNPTWTYRR